MRVLLDAHRRYVDSRSGSSLWIDMLPRRFLLVFVVSTMRCSDAPTAHADVAASPSAYAAQTPSESVLTVKTEPPAVTVKVDVA